MLINISDDDASQVKAILLTHAEMQDQQSIRNETLRGQMKEDPEEAKDPEDRDETIKDLEEIHEEIISDRDNLKRIAELFGAS